MMNVTYEFLHVTTAPRSWPTVIRGLADSGFPAIEDAGGAIYGLWISQIGLPMNEGVIAITWPEGKIPKAGAAPLILAASDSVLKVDSQRLAATVRPLNPESPKDPGIYMHRWFGVAKEDWQEFLQLSQDAWPDFEAETGANVIGFWRKLEEQTERVNALLITRYPSMAAWEASRGENSRSAAASEAWEKFVRRHQMTQSMVASSMELILAEGFLKRTDQA